MLTPNQTARLRELLLDAIESAEDQAHHRDNFGLSDDDVAALVEQAEQDRELLQALGG